MRNAATPWAGAMSDQVGLIGTHWSKGWIVEGNTISHSICTGITLGRYEFLENTKPPETAPGFVRSVELAIRPVAVQASVAQVVSEDDYDVWLGGVGRRWARNGQRQQPQGEERGLERETPKNGGIG